MGRQRPICRPDEESVDQACKSCSQSNNHRRVPVVSFYRYGARSGIDRAAKNPQAQAAGSDLMLIVLTTTSNPAEAESLAHKIVEARLAACVQILPPMRSIYFWNETVQNDAEHLLLIKTIAEKFDQLEEFILANHSYDTPEIVAIDAERVSEHYDRWLTTYLT